MAARVGIDSPERSVAEPSMVEGVVDPLLEDLQLAIVAHEAAVVKVVVRERDLDDVVMAVKSRARMVLGKGHERMSSTELEYLADRKRHRFLLRSDA
jgi:hypothetical protein